MSSLSFVSSSIVYYLVFKVQPISFETFSCCLESLDAVYRLGHLRCPASKLSSVSQEIFLVGSSGLEPPTSRLSGVRSNHLSYEPLKVVEISGIEPLTSCVQGRRSPSWAKPPSFTTVSSFWKSFPRPSKLNNIQNKNLCSLFHLLVNSTVSLERRWSSRTFRYGYLVTTSPQSPVLPSATPSLRLGYGLRVPPALMVWRAVCTRPGNVFTAACWSAITSNSGFL